MSQEQQRLFVAVPLDHDGREIVQKQCDRLRMNFPFQKWTHSMDYHITLKFLGEVLQDKVQRIQDLLLLSAEETAPFTLTLDSLGTFGQKAAPSILWAGIGGDTQSLGRLHANVEKTLSTLGFVNENLPFHPHITLARRFDRQLSPNSLFLDIEQKRFAKSTHTWTVDEMLLYKSHVKHQPMYEAIARIRLRK